MSQYRPDPFINIDGIQKIQQELGKLFENDWVKAASQYATNGEWSPATDCIETDSQWQFVIDLPGVSLDDIDLSILRSEIQIKGSKPSVSIGEVVSSQRQTGVFSKTLSLPDDVDEASLAASMQNGVLTLTVDKSRAESARSIPIKDVG